MNVAPSSVAEIEMAPNFEDLATEYEEEALIDGMPPPRARWETYRALEGTGMLRVFSAVLDGQLIGFISILASRLPRYDVPIAVSESFFVAKAHRKTGAGLKLLKMAEDKARGLGSPGLLVSCPYGGDLFKVLPRVGYVETSRIFFKRVAHA